MSLEIIINAEMKTAMLAKDEARLRGLRAIKAAVLLAKTDGRVGDLTEEDEIKLLQKLAKQRKDSLELFAAQGREDLAAKEREEIAVIEAYLPVQLDDAELRSELQLIIAQADAKGPGDIGKVMGLAVKQLGGKVDGKRISAMMKELLS